MRYFLTLDVGTTSVKTGIFNEEFHRVGFTSYEYEDCASGNGIVELDAETYWTAAKNGIAKVMQGSNISAMDISVITIVTQGETLIPVDVNGKPLRNAIVWLDARAVVESDYIQAGFSNDKIYAATGLPEMGPACPVSKVLWIKNNEADIFERTYKFMLLEDFLIMKLTGRFVTEKCLMSSTGYFDINQGTLWGEMLQYIDVDAARFPEILDCGICVGGILLDVADDLGINPALVVSTGAMDQAASAIGAGNIASGVVTETTGTALVVAATIDTPDFNNAARINIMRHGIKGKYLILPYNQTAGIILKWFKDEFCQEETNKCSKAGESIYAYLDQLAATSSPLSNGLLLLPHFAGMLTPEMNPEVKGVFFGVGLDTKKAHVIRAILEAIAYMLRQNLDLLGTMGIHAEEIRSLGGGSKSELWSQIKADINNCVIHHMEQEESTSLGAAILGSLAVGMYGTAEEACSTVKIIKSYLPENDAVQEYEKGYERYKKLYVQLKCLFY